MRKISPMCRMQLEIVSTELYASRRVNKREIKRKRVCFDQREEAVTRIGESNLWPQSRGFIRH